MQPTFTIRPIGSTRTLFGTAIAAVLLIATATPSVAGPNKPAVFCSGLAVPVTDNPGRIIVGTAGDDVLNGSTRDDVIIGLGGNDVINGLSGDDIICGGDGDDRITGSTGDDQIHGDAGNDQLRGGLGDDVVLGGTGDDAAWGGPGDDRIFSHGGEDTIRGGSGNDDINGGRGNDVVWGGSGDDFLNGQRDDDIVVGGDGADICDGGTHVNTFDSCERFRSRNAIITVGPPDGDVYSFATQPGLRGVLFGPCDSDASMRGWGPDTVVGLDPVPFVSTYYQGAVVLPPTAGIYTAEGRCTFHGSSIVVRVRFAHDPA